jgi:DNA-binding MarR family transcriptional regulator
MTRIVNGLEEDGFARREQDEGDRRVVRVHATAKGKRVLGRARARRIATLADRLSALDSDEIAVVQEAADLVEASLRRSSAPGAPPARGGGSSGSQASRSRAGR